MSEPPIVIAVVAILFLAFVKWVSFALGIRRIWAALEFCYPWWALMLLARVAKDTKAERHFCRYGRFLLRVMRDG